MKRLLLAMLLAFATQVQAKRVQPILADPHTVVDTKPTFKGGEFEEFAYWVRDNIKFPRELNKKGISAEAIVEFIVEKDGSISGIEILNDTYKGLVREVTRKMNSAPRLTPAVKDGKAVRYLSTFVVGWDVDANSVVRREKHLKRSFQSEFGYTYLSHRKTSLSYHYNVDYSRPEGIVRVIKQAESQSLGYQSRYTTYSSSYYVPELTRWAYVKQIDDPTNGSYKHSDNQTHTYTTVDVAPQMESGGAYVEFLDWMFDSLSELEDYDFARWGVPFSNIIHQADGSITYSYSINASTQSRKAIRELFNNAPKFTPAMVNDRAVKYKYVFSTKSRRSFKELAKDWTPKLFTRDTKSAIAEGQYINIVYTDCLPSYNNGSLWSFKRSIINRASEILKEQGKTTAGSVDIRILLGKDGAINKVDIVWLGNNESFAQAVAQAYIEMPTDLWTPAEAYGEAVNCIIWL